MPEVLLRLPLLVVAVEVVGVAEKGERVAVGEPLLLLPLLLLPLLVRPPAMMERALVAQAGRACARPAGQTLLRKRRTRCWLTRHARQDLHLPLTQEDITSGAAGKKGSP